MKLTFIVCAALLTGVPLQHIVVAAPKISNSQQWKLDQDLRLAARKGDSAQALSFLARGAHINAPDIRGETAMHWVVIGGNEPLAAYFLKKGGNTGARNNDGITPLMYAISPDPQIGMVKRLLDAGAKINVRDKFGMTVFDYAVYKSRTEIARLLLDRGADVNVSDNQGWTPLITAVQKESAEMLTMLLQKGANVNATMKDGWTALMSAASLPNLQIVCVLLQNGAGVSMKNKEGQTALSLARRALEDSPEISPQDLAADVEWDEGAAAHRKALSLIYGTYQLEVKPGYHELFRIGLRLKILRHQSRVDINENFVSLNFQMSLVIRFH
jgi:ankyrin repeat protein